MKFQTTIALVILACGFTLAAGVEFGTENTAGLLSRSLAEADQFDTSQLSCATPQKEFVQITKDLQAWSDILEHQGDINSDIKILKQVEKILIEVRKQSQQEQNDIILLQMKDVSKIIEQKLNNLVLPQTSSKVGQTQIEEIKAELQRLNSQDPSERTECCNTLLRLSSYLIHQLENINQQCQQRPVTIIRIKGKIQEIHVIQAGCGAKENKINVIPSKGGADVPLDPQDDDSDDVPEGETEKPSGDKPTEPSAPAGNEPAGGEPAADKPAGGEPAGEEPAGGEPAGEEPAGGEPAGDEPAGGEPAGDEPAGGEPAGEEPAGGEPAGEEPAGGEPAGDEPAGGEPAGDEPAGGEPAGEEPAGGEPAGDEPAGGEPAGDEPAGGEPAGDKPAGEPSDPATGGSDPAVPAQNQQPINLISRCEHYIQITSDNAADVLCALGQYLSQLAHGQQPNSGANTKKICFCLNYNPDEANPELIQLGNPIALPKQNSVPIVKILMNNAQNPKK